MRWATLSLADIVLSLQPETMAVSYRASSDIAPIFELTGGAPQSHY
jgi:hypothetical protein